MTFFHHSLAPKMSGEAKSNQKDIELGCLHEGGKQGQGITIKKMKSNGSQKRREQTKQTHGELKARHM